jgi:hypothetical protein
MYCMTNLARKTILEIQAMYAYHLGIKDSKLSIAIKLELFHKPLMAESIDPYKRAIKVILEGKETQIKPDVGMG